MAELKIDTVCTIWNGTSGTIHAVFGEQKMEIKMTNEQCAEVNALALRYVQARQQALADEIASAQPALLMPPEVQDATWSEVNSTDDIPF